MSSILDIDSLEEKPPEKGRTEAPKSWQKHKLADWYFVLLETKSDMLDMIKGDPDAFTEEGFKIKKADISEKMGKNKSHLSPSQWKSKDTPAKKAKAFLVKEIGIINDSLRLGRLAALDARARNPNTTIRSKAALCRDIEELRAGVRKVQERTWSDLLSQLNSDGREASNKRRELEEALKNAQETIRNQAGKLQESTQDRSRDLAEIDRLKKLNDDLSADLREARERCAPPPVETTASIGELVALRGSRIDIHAPPEGINEEAWAEWVRWRAEEKRKKVTPTAAKQQWKMLLTLSLEEQARVIHHSIASDYQALTPSILTDRRGSQGSRNSSLIQDLIDTSWAE